MAQILGSRSPEICPPCRVGTGTCLPSSLDPQERSPGRERKDELWDPYHAGVGQGQLPWGLENQGKILTPGQHLSEGGVLPSLFGDQWQHSVWGSVALRVTGRRTPGPTWDGATVPNGDGGKGRTLLPHQSQVGHQLLGPVFLGSLCLTPGQGHPAMLRPPPPAARSGHTSLSHPIFAPAPAGSSTFLVPHLSFSTRRPH